MQQKGPWISKSLALEAGGILIFLSGARCAEADFRLREIVSPDRFLKLSHAPAAIRSRDPSGNFHDQREFPEFRRRSGGALSAGVPGDWPTACNRQFLVSAVQFHATCRLRRIPPKPNVGTNRLCAGSNRT